VIGQATTRWRIIRRHIEWRGVSGESRHAAGMRRCSRDHAGLDPGRCATARRFCYPGRPKVRTDRCCRT